MTPFSFDQNLQEGKWAQATCSVTSGDLPIYFTWLKDGAPIPPSLRVSCSQGCLVRREKTSSARDINNLSNFWISTQSSQALSCSRVLFQIEEQVQTFYSLLLFHEVSSRHSGKYTCIATNHAAKVNHTAELLVKVPPQWISEPQDISTLLGNPLNVHCEAKGFPPPQITWLRGHERSSNDFQPLIGLEGRITIQPNGSLWTASAGPQDEGHYLCRANNGIGLGLNKLIYVSVNGESISERFILVTSSL